MKKDTMPFAAPLSEKGRSAFAQNSLQTLRELISERPAGNRWYKVNLHVHGQNHDPAEVVQQARLASVDLIAITDHQSFNFCEGVITAAGSPGRPLKVLPGMEITAHEGVHVIGVFPGTLNSQAQAHFVGWLEIPGSGLTRVASRRTVDEIFKKIDELGGIVVIPHPNTQGIGLLDSARKLSTKEQWLESGHVRLMQISEEAVRYIGHDAAGNWINRFVLATAQDRHVQSSSYCLAPFNRSDSHAPEEIGEGCSWFRMQELSVEGLKQVACEPRTRISRTEPVEHHHACILGVRVSGGYCDGQLFRFNDGLSCLVGDNHSGKSAVLDFIRFGLGQDEHIPADARLRLLDRLYGILGESGCVEVYVRSRGSYFVAKRSFQPEMRSRGAGFVVERCSEEPCTYMLDETQGLIPTMDFRFPLEVYEQGRIGRLREDVERQLEMLDEFADLTHRKKRRAGAIERLTESAMLLKPLYEEREALVAGIAGLSHLEQELLQKEALLPNTQEEQCWADAAVVVQRIEGVIDQLRDATEGCPIPSVPRNRPATELDRLFGQISPPFDGASVAQSETLIRWVDALRITLDKLDGARLAILAAFDDLLRASQPLRAEWQAAVAEHHRVTSEQLARAGVESPKEVIRRVEWLRGEISRIKDDCRPRLAEIKSIIGAKEEERAGLLERLEELDREITSTREAKARELTDRLNGEVQIAINPASDVTEYKKTLSEICAQVSTSSIRIQNRDSQINLVVQSIRPLALARALQQKGRVQRTDGQTTDLHTLCGITEHTQSVLCGIGRDIELITKIQTISIPDVPRILVRRRRESTYAPLHSGLSPGEQSAAILTLALETRAMPLILDQPEDELGYGYVVHLIVPKLLRAKFSRQIIIVTHDANIPVLGDSDHVTKMENLPDTVRGRSCVATATGCFESAPVTAALLDLEGGHQAFQFRQHRYGLRNGSGRAG